MEIDVVLLARLQFALTIMVHYLFPPLSIGLGLQLVITEALFLKTGDPRWEALARFWTKIFAVNFAVGVATGIVMEFEFGTNWATYSRFVGDVFGSALASEGIFAFFLESGFLAVLVFGWDRVGPRMHMFSTLMVFLGSVFSSVWIVIANSWMHTPTGYHLVGEGDRMRAEITDFWAMVFNPSAMHRLGHVLLGAFLLGAFFTMSIAAYYLLKRRHEDLAKRAMAVGLVTAAVCSLAMGVSGHSQAVMVAELSPTKLAAMEGLFVTGDGGTGLTLVGWPDQEAETTHGLEVPGLLSLLVHGDPSVPVEGLDQTAPEDRPPVVVPFLAYHLMLASAGWITLLAFGGLFLLWRRKLFDKRWLLWLFVGSVVVPYIGNQAGWVASEVARQPWIVYGLLRTSDAVSRTVPGEQVLASIVLFGVIYTALIALWVFVMNEKIQHGPVDVPSDDPSDGLPGAAAGFVSGRISMTGRDAN